MFLGQMVHVQEIGGVDQESIHEKLAAGVDADDLWGMVEIRHGHGRVRLRIDVLGRPGLREHDAVVELLALVFRPWFLNGGLGDCLTEAEKDAPLAEPERLACGERLTVKLDALVGVGAEELERRRFGDPLEAVRGEAGRDRGGAWHVGRRQCRKRAGLGAAHAEAVDARAEKGLAPERGWRLDERVRAVGEEAYAGLENRSLAGVRAARGHLDRGRRGGEGREEGARYSE